MEVPCNVERKWYEKGWRRTIITEPMGNVREEYKKYCLTVLLIMLLLAVLLFGKNLFSLGFKEKRIDINNQNNETNVFADFWEQFSNSKLYFLLFPIPYNVTTAKSLSTEPYKSIVKPKEKVSTIRLPITENNEITVSTILKTTEFNHSHFTFMFETDTAENIVHTKKKKFTKIKGSESNQGEEAENHVNKTNSRLQDSVTIHQENSVSPYISKIQTNSLNKKTTKIVKPKSLAALNVMKILKPIPKKHSTVGESISIKKENSMHPSTYNLQFSSYFQGTEQTMHLMKRMSTTYLPEAFEVLLNKTNRRVLKSRNKKKHKSNYSFRIYIDRSESKSLQNTFSDFLFPGSSFIFSNESKEKTVLMNNNEFMTEKQLMTYQDEAEAKYSTEQFTFGDSITDITKPMSLQNIDFDESGPHYSSVIDSVRTERTVFMTKNKSSIEQQLESSQSMLEEINGREMILNTEQTTVSRDYVKASMDKSISTSLLESEKDFNIFAYSLKLNNGSTENTIMTNNEITMKKITESEQDKLFSTNGIDKNLSNIEFYSTTDFMNIDTSAITSSEKSDILSYLSDRSMLLSSEGKEINDHRIKPKSSSKTLLSNQELLNEINDMETISSIHKEHSILLNVDGVSTCGDIEVSVPPSMYTTNTLNFFHFQTHKNKSINQTKHLVKQMPSNEIIFEPYELSLNYTTEIPVLISSPKTDAVSYLSIFSLSLGHSKDEFATSTKLGPHNDKLKETSVNERKNMKYHYSRTLSALEDLMNNKMDIIVSTQLPETVTDFPITSYSLILESSIGNEGPTEWSVVNNQTNTVPESATFSANIYDESGFISKQKMVHGGFNKAPQKLYGITETNANGVNSNIFELGYNISTTDLYFMSQRYISSIKDSLITTPKISNFTDNTEIITVMTSLITENYSWADSPEWKYDEHNIDISHYDLVISHNTTNLRGEISITMQVYAGMDEVILQFEGDEVLSSKILKMKKSSTEEHTEINVEKIIYEKKKGRIIIRLFEKMTPENNYTISMNFTSQLNQFERGGSLTKYVPRKVDFNMNKERWVIGSYLYPNYGKSIFPCIEAPNRLSTFHLRINHMKREKTVSNTIKKITEQGFGPEEVLDEFVTTPAIPVSSFMFHIMQDYDFVTFNRTRTPALTIWYPPYLKNSIIPLAEISLAVLDFFYKYFQYNIPTQQISIIVCEGLYSDPPASFGAILISSKYLYEKIGRKYKNSENLHYYLAKQFCDLWIGNIVNFNSWNDNWIKTGFSKYMAHLATNEIYDDYDISSFIMGKQVKVFQFHRLSQFRKDNLYNKGGRKNIGTSYKAAFLFHMVYNVLKENTFKEGIRLFFKKWALRNIDPKDLWDSFNMVQGNINITQFIQTWNNNDYPIVNVGTGNNSIIIEHVPDTSSPNEVGSWWIPITYVIEQDLYFDYTITHWMKQQKRVQINLHLNKSWIILNPQYSAFFRTNYTEGLWKQLINELRKQHTKFPSILRAQILDEAFTLAADGLLDYSVPMTMALYLEHEEEYAPWEIALKHYSDMAEFLVDYPEWQQLQDLVANLMNNITQKLGIERENEKAIDGQLRKLLVTWSCLNELPNGCTLWASQKFENWRDNVTFTSRNLIPIELRSIVYCMGAKIGEGATKFLYSFSKMSMVTPDEEMRLLRAISCTDGFNTFIDVLEDIINISNPTSSLLRLKEFWQSLWQSHKNSLISFQYVTYNWRTIYERFHGADKLLDVIIEGATYFLRTKDHLKEIIKLREQVPQNEYSLLNTLDYAIDRIGYNINWKSKNLHPLRKWLRYYHIRLAV